MISRATATESLCDTYRFLTPTAARGPFLRVKYKTSPAERTAKVGVFHFLWYISTIIA